MPLKWTHRSMYTADNADPLLTFVIVRDGVGWTPSVNLLNGEPQLILGREMETLGEAQKRCDNYLLTQQRTKSRS